MATESLERSLSRLNRAELERGVAELTELDSRLGRLFDANGYPPLWGREPGFPTLVKIILEQQVSLDSAAAAFANLENAIGIVAPEPFLTLDNDELKRIGFSRQKTGYVRTVASGLLDGTIDLALLEKKNDEDAFRYLTAIRGIGPWTADVYLLFALSRPNVWPHGDRALVVSMAEQLPLEEVPSYPDADVIARAWEPWRSVAARMFWHAYLAKRGRSLE